MKEEGHENHALTPEEQAWVAMPVAALIKAWLDNAQEEGPETIGPHRKAWNTLSASAQPARALRSADSWYGEVNLDICLYLPTWRE